MMESGKDRRADASTVSASGAAVIGRRRSDTVLNSPLGKMGQDLNDGGEDDEESPSLTSVVVKSETKMSFSSRRSSLPALTVALPSKNSESEAAEPPSFIEIESNEANTASLTTRMQETQIDSARSSDPILVPLRTARVPAAAAKRKARLSGSDACPLAKSKLEQMFFEWLSLADTEQAMQNLTTQYSQGIVQVVNPDLDSADGRTRSAVFNSNAAAALAPSPHSLGRRTRSSCASASSPNTGSGGSNATTNPFGFNLYAAPMSPVTTMLNNSIEFNLGPLMSPRQSLQQQQWYSDGGADVNDATTGLRAQSRADGQDGVGKKSPSRSMIRVTSQSLAKARSSRRRTAASKKEQPEIPKFFHPIGEGIVEHEEMEMEMINEFFDEQGSADSTIRTVSRADFPELLVEVVGIPSFFSGVVFDRIVNPSPESENPSSAPAESSRADAGGARPPKKNPDSGSSKAHLMSEKAFREYYRNECKGRSRPLRMFNAILDKQHAERSYLIGSDFAPLLEALLGVHPGLSFLHSTPEFQQRYAETVVERILYRLARHVDGRIYFSEFHRLDFLETLMEVDEEEDINRERMYFSYEHFYVLYCRFWELDIDHDLYLTKDDLARYSEHSLTFRIVDRIFDGAGRPLDSELADKMSYSDFIWFCLSEEDKKTPTAKDYWFRCLDRDGDGIVTLADLDFFYEEQLHRMECIGQEPILFYDILCQLLDMVRPHFDRPHIYLHDIRKCKLASAFYNTLFNLNKLIDMETRKPRPDRFLDATDWDRFAAVEYLRLSADDDPDGGAGGEDGDMDTTGDDSDAEIGERSSGSSRGGVTAGSGDEGEENDDEDYDDDENWERVDLNEVNFDDAF